MYWDIIIKTLHVLQSLFNKILMIKVSVPIIVDTNIFNQNIKTLFVESSNFVP